MAAERERERERMCACVRMCETIKKRVAETARNAAEGEREKKT